MRKIICLISVLCFLLITFSYSRSSFKGIADEITYYVSASSSNAKVVFKDVLLKTGESFSADNDEINVEKLIKDFNAVLVFIEEVDESINYYYYTDKLRTEKYLNGKKVNLHISVNKTHTTVGTPIIFGSF